MTLQRQDGAIRLPRHCDVGEAEAEADAFFRREQPLPQELVLDMSSCVFVEVATLVWALGLIKALDKAGHPINVRLPRDKKVRDFLRVWQFPRAVKDAVGVSLDCFLSDSDKRVLRSDEEEGMDKMEYAGRVLNMRGMEQRLVSEDFFAFTSFPPRTSSSGEGLAEAQHRRWRQDHIVSVLDRHLSARGDTVGSHIVHEAMLNALRHPRCRLIFMVSFLDRPSDYSLSKRNGIRDWRGFFGRLRLDRIETRPNPRKRIWELLPPDISRAITGRGTKAPLRKEFEGAFLGALNGLLSRRDLYQRESFAAVTLCAEAQHLLAYGVKSLSRTEMQKVNRYLIEAAFPNEVVQMDRGHLTIVFWDDGESIVDTLRKAIDADKKIRSLEPGDLCADYLVTRENELGEKSSPQIIASDLLPNANTEDALLLLASLFPGITRDVAGEGHVVPAEVEAQDRRFGLPGMGLYVLANQAVDVFGGMVSLRTKDYFLNLQGVPPAARGRRSERYTVKLRTYGPWYPQFPGNAVTVRLPLK